VDGVAVDLRALQAPDHATRGIGRYTLQLIEGIEARDPSAVRAYVVDPAFPLHLEAQRLLQTGKLRRSDSVELTDAPPRVFHTTSPFAEGSSRDAPALPDWATAEVRLIATAYDLIPARFPDVYLRADSDRRWYQHRLALLPLCDRILSISESTSRDLIELAGVPDSRIVTVHGAAGPGFGPGELAADVIRAELTSVDPERVASGFVLVPTGIEWRKNLDRLLQAWSMVDPALRHRTPLVVQCHLAPDARCHLDERIRSLGLRDSVLMTGEVGDAELVALYRSATLVVFPSLYEGLGLPVLEARACGSPVVCSDSSSMAEIVERPEARFDPMDPADIARVVELHLRDPSLRSDLAADPVPERYELDAVCRLVLGVYRDLATGRGRIVASRRPRIAVASPVPPQLSGPSAYMAALLEHLVDLCDVTLLTSVEPAAVVVPAGIRVERITSLPLLELAEGRFDEVVYFIGNSPFHVEELRMLRRRPGCVILHDARLTILHSELAVSHPEEMPGGFGGALHRMYPGRYPGVMGGSGYLPLPEEGLYGVLMVRDVAELATRLFVHSSHAADLVELDCGRRPEVVFPIPSPPVNDADPAPGEQLVASFGFVSPAKRSELVLESMVGLPDVDLALVGDSGEEFLQSLRRRADELDIGDRVHVTGRIDAGAYDAWLARSTVAVQLRMHSNGESSASVAETLAAGVPTVVTDIGTFSEYPDDVVVKVPVDLGPRELAAVLRQLLADSDRREELRNAGRRYAAEHSYRHAARPWLSTLGVVRSGSSVGGW